MCWSATADLVAGAGIVGVGVAALGLARAPRDVPLAALPVLLGAHQLVEAHLWSGSEGKGSVLTGPGVDVWTYFAFAVLPLYVPAALLLAQRERRLLQVGAGVLGLPVAVVMAVAVGSGATATDLGRTLEYRADVPLLPVVLAGYLVATLGPFLLSPERSLRELGVVLLVGAMAATAVSVAAFASLWCAVAAAASLMVVRRTWTAAAAAAPAPATATPTTGAP